ncbi:mast cell protease 1A-like [Suricata suricatta]|uniref:mast cell protease 1A-like n=1 Tax=Suricata suricatta TaxID=37032 RepID=UPI00115532C9|nr:mast cell protease 1A-like [Suricata suricatta]
MQPLLLLLDLLLPLEAKTEILPLTSSELRGQLSHESPGCPFFSDLRPLPHEQSRQSRHSLSGKIIGGHEAKPHSRPFMAYIQYQNPDGIWKYCGGFLVREDYVLTAAHCKGSSITVILGAHNIKKQEMTWQIIPVGKITPHPEYNPKTLRNDIMLLQLKWKANLNAYVSPLRLPKRTTMVRPGMVCSVAGWGRLSVNSLHGADKLQEVELEIQKDELCISLYTFLYDSTTQICAGDPRKRKDSFKGDSGGPLVCNTVAQGIVSFGKKDGNPPGVYTRISSFMPWIEKTMRPFSLQRPD